MIEEFRSKILQQRQYKQEINILKRQEIKEIIVGTIISIINLLAWIISIFYPLHFYTFAIHAEEFFLVTVFSLLIIFLIIPIVHSLLFLLINSISTKFFNTSLYSSIHHEEYILKKQYVFIHYETWLDLF